MTEIKGQIVKNLISSEPVTINEIQELGESVAIEFTGVNTNKSDNIIIDRVQFENLEVLTKKGAFNFTGDPNKFKLYAEAERINSAYQFDPLFAVNCSVIDPLPHQIEAVYKYLLPQPKIRFLLADDTGAGKTIMTGLLLKELMMRGLVERTLVITPGGLTKQWQEDELGLKFNIPFKLVNRAAFESDPTIFSHSDRLVASIDFIRGDDVLNVVKETSWDLIVVDEAHKLSAFDYGQRQYKSKRYTALETLASKCEHLLLLTATPHRGRRDTFKNLLQLLDEDIFANDSLVSSRIKEIGNSGTNKFFIRRLKEEMRDWNDQPLFKDRHTKTVMYELTPEEKDLYNSVTKYLMRKREEAKSESNIHVSLALMVMQRRLTSSIYAIRNTLKNRYTALSGLVAELNNNPSLWKQRVKLEMDFNDLDDYDEFDDDEKESLENILSDPRKFKLFTTAKSPHDIKEEAEEVKVLFEKANALLESQIEEEKFTRLRLLLKNNNVIDENEKIVIFTEHKDTLVYLERRLRKSGGFEVVTIHGGKNVDERRLAQTAFAKDAQILIATDAAGEGINLQFCRLLINWDIPWNPNRLEQRMGRIHRYGQKEEVLVFNMVANNTREGMVLQRLLGKLDTIREQMGDDRVYDVISDVFENISLEDIINSTFNGDSTKYNDAIDTEFTEENVRKKIREQKESLGYSKVDYQEAKTLKENSDETRLQPIYIQLFFEKAFHELGGTLETVKSSVYRIVEMPEVISKRLKNRYNIVSDFTKVLLCFDKQVFLDYQQIGEGDSMYYVNPGNPVFDSMINVVIEVYKEEMLKGTVLISADEEEDHFTYFVRSQIKDNRPDGVADERLLLVEGLDGSDFGITSPAKFLDLHPPNQFAKEINPPELVENKEVVNWSYEYITKKQLEETKVRVHKDVSVRKDYLEESFNNIMADLTEEINEMQGKMILGNTKVEEKIAKKQSQLNLLKEKKKERMEKMEAMKELKPKLPEILGCAYVIPLSQVEYKSHYGMSRDDESEVIAMETTMAYEKSQYWVPEDVGSQNLGYDIRSVNPERIKRYIEVKGRSGSDGSVMLTENEMNRLSQLGPSAWLYIVLNCKTNPELYRIQDPANALSFEKKIKGVQYYLAMNSWKGKEEN